MSIDGKIATRTGRSKFSSDKDLGRVHRLRAGMDAILVGRNTVSVDDPYLTVRQARGRNPTRIILDPRASISLQSKIVRTAKEVPTIVVVTAQARPGRRSLLLERGLDVMQCGKSKIGLRQMLYRLASRGIGSILVEGGGTTNWHFLKSGLVDEIIVTITPYVVGGKEAVSLVEGMGYGTILHKFKLKQAKRMGNEVILRYVS